MRAISLMTLLALWASLDPHTASAQSVDLREAWQGRSGAFANAARPGAGFSSKAMNTVYRASAMPTLLRACIAVVTGMVSVAAPAGAGGANEAVRQAMPLTVERTAGNDEPGVVLDSIIHTSIEIECPPAAVWLHILNSNAWTRLHLIRREGPAGEVGEIFALVDPANRDRIRTVFAKNLELAPEQRRTFKIYDRTGRRGGYVTWTLQGIGESTLVSYDIYYQEFLPQGEAPPTRDDRQSAMREGSEAELQQLKKLVEAKSPMHGATRAAR